MRRRILLVALLALTGLPAFAHDPGLSSAKLTLESDRLEAAVTFAPGDIAALSNGTKKNSQEMEQLGRDCLAVTADGSICHPTRISTRTLDNKDIEFDLVYPLGAATKLTVRSTLMDLLPFGHRQYFSLVNSGGVTLDEKLLSGSSPEAQMDLPGLAAPVAAVSHPFTEFLGMGVKHILTGYDHLLFLFSLLLVCKRLSSVVRIITAFTIAHSISLALATLGWVEIPSRIVEPMIAASIVYVCIENLTGRAASSQRVWLTFCFGLVHGFGFAGALREMGVGAHGSAIAVPLLAFNSGVELGQMAVASLVLPILWKLKDRPQFALRWAPACSVVVALAGAFWFIQRVFGA